MAKKIYSKTRKILADDVNMLREMRHSVFLRWLQEASIAHTEELGAGRDKTLDRGALWIIARVKVKITRMPEYDETVTMTTWPGETRHVLFPRYYEITDADGNAIVKASAVWLLMDAATRKMTFPEKFDVRVPGTVTGREIPLPTGTAPCSETTVHGRHKVAFQDVDINGHMNNSKYIDIVEDCLGFGFMTLSRLTGFEINYLNEIRAGKRVALDGNVSDGRISFSGHVGKTPCFNFSATYIPRE